MTLMYKDKNTDPVQINTDLFQTNMYLNKNNEIIPRFKAIHDGIIPYCTDDYPLLIQCFERLYKGVCKELQDLYPDKIRLQPSEYIIGHHFTHFISIVNRIIPVSDNKNGYYRILNKCKRLEARYNDARYLDIYTFEDFKQDFKRFELATYRLYNALEKHQEKIRNEIAAEEDLENW